MLMVFTSPPVYSGSTAPRSQEGIQKASATARRYLKGGGGSHKKRKRQRNSTTPATFFFILQLSGGKAAFRVGGNGDNLVGGQTRGFWNRLPRRRRRRIQSHLHNPITAKSKNKWRPGRHPLPGGNSTTFRPARWLRKGQTAPAAWVRAGAVLR